MNTQEILTQAIEKAVANGWVNSYGYRRYKIHEWKLFIFEHDFAKALWGEEMLQVHRFIGTVDGATADYPQQAWQCHLQQMVLAEDPIQYLGNNLP
jgi:hypothetical protein